LKKILFKWETISRFLGLLCLIVFFIYIVIFTNLEIVDPDIWLHLKTGELIVQNSSLPKTDPFSFTLNSKNWIDHEWLFQIMVYFMHHNFGPSGLIFIQSLTICLMFITLLFFGYKRNNHLIIVTALLITLYASRTRINIRPDIFSVFLFIITILILKKYIHTRLIYILIPLQILWANLHGYFILGPIIVLFFLVGELIQSKLKFNRKKIQITRIQKIKFFRLILIFSLLVFASFINPYTYQGALYPVNIMFGSLTKSNIFLKNIVELMSPIVLYIKYNNNFSYYFFMIFFSLITFIFNWRRIRIADLLIWFFLLLASLKFARNVMFFTMFSGIVCIENMNDIDVAFLKKKLIRSHKVDKRKKYLIEIILKILFIIWISKIAINSIFYSGYYLFDKYEMKARMWGFSEKEYPLKAVDFISKNNLPARLFNDFNSGSYLIGRCFPQRQVFIDGRTELYGARFLNDYEKMMKADKSVIRQMVQKYKLEGFFITGIPGGSDNNIIKYLYRDNEYKTVYFDENAIIFLKDTPENQDLIKKFAFDLKNWRAPEIDLLKVGTKSVYPYPYARRVQILEMLQLDEATTSELEQIQRISPDAFVYHSVMGEILYRKKQFNKAFENFRLALIMSSPKNTDIRIELASCYAELDQADKAISELKSIVKKDSNKHKALQRLGFIYDKIGDNQNAIKYLKEAIKINPEIPTYYQTLAQIYYKNKDFNNALKEWKELLKFEPDNTEAIANIKKIEAIIKKD